MNILEIALFCLAITGVIGFGIRKSRVAEHNSGSASDYFLAGRRLRWYLVGFSLIAANISTEQFVGMSGKAAAWLGMAIASYEWFAAITLVVIAFVFLPTFLKTGIYTVPEFLEYRFDPFSRMVMAVATLIILVGVPTASVIFSGAKVISGYYPDIPILGNLTYCCWIIATLAAAYVFVGGLRACAWTDLIWGSSLIVAGALVAWLAMNALALADPGDLAQTATHKSIDLNRLAAAGPLERFTMLNAGAAQEGGKLHMVRPLDDTEIPWSALLIGLWIPNFFYWGFNQYIVQRTLGSRSLSDGQKGIIFAAFLKLLIPFVVVVPGMLAFNLYHEQLAVAGQTDYDAAFPTLLRNLVKPHPWLSWFVLAAIFGAIVSSLASMLNSASTIATMDLIKRWLPQVRDAQLPIYGRVFLVVFAIIAALIAPSLGEPQFGGIFTFIQEFQGFISPGVLAIFLFGILAPKAPKYIGWTGILLNAILYGAFKWWLGDAIAAANLWFSEEISFLDRMAICFIVVCAYCALATLITPQTTPISLPTNQDVELSTLPSVKIAGSAVILLTIVLYGIFW